MALAPITENQRRIVEKDIGYNSKEVQEKVKQIKGWMEKQPHLPQIPGKLADKLIHEFLVGTKLSSEKTKYKIDTYYSMRHQIPEVFLDRDPTGKDIRDSVDRIRIFPLSELTPEGFRILFVSYNSEGDKFNNKDLKGSYQRIVSIHQSMMLQEDFSAGVYIIFDCRGLYFSHIVDLSWSLVLRFATYVQEGMPFRIKKIVLINTSKWIDTILNIVNPVLKEKLKKRIVVCEGDHTNLYQFIPQRMLPSDLGGEAPSVEELSRTWQKTIEAMRDTIIEDEKYITDESKRPKDSINQCGQLFGVNGSFNKLNID